MRTHLDLFSGIGGFALSARWAGIETVQFVEIDKFCQKVLQKNFPGVPIHDDIKSFTNANWDRLQKQRAEQQASGNRQLFQNKPFLITGGFPCQPFSCAGKRRGKEDDRYLWEEMLRVIKEFKPTWIIGENVNGIRSMEFQDGLSELEGDSLIQEDGNSDYTNVLDGICDSLEAIGYEVQPVIIPACAVNAPHRRDRVWIVANRLSRPTKIRHAGTVECENGKEGDGRKTKIQNTASYRNCHAPDTSNQGLQRGEETGNTSINGEESRNELIGRCLGWEEPWIEVATRLCRIPHGLSDELHQLETSDRVARLKALGNAIVPQVAFAIMQAIIEVDNETKKNTQANP